MIAYDPHEEEKMRYIRETLSRVKVMLERAGALESKSELLVIWDLDSTDFILNPVKFKEFEDKMYQIVTMN